MHILMMVLIISLASVGCSKHQAKGKYPLGPCVGEFCLGQTEKDFNMEGCFDNSRVKSVVIHDCDDLKVRVDFGGIQAINIYASFLNSYLSAAVLKFDTKDCRAIKGQLTTAFGESPVTYFPPANMERSKAGLGDLVMGYEWKTENGRLSLINDMDNGKDVGFCSLQMEARWINDELRNSLKSDKSVSG